MTKWEDRRWASRATGGASGRSVTRSRPSCYGCGRCSGTTSVTLRRQDRRDRGGGPLVFRVAVLSFWHVHAKDYALETKEHPRTEITAVWDVDRVVVTTPTVAHREVIPAAARASKHVFAEKVIAPTLSEAREVVEEVEEAGVTFVISLPRLYAGYTQAIREILAGGAIGEPTYLRVRVSHDGALPSVASPLGWLPERFFDPRQSAGGVT